MSELLPCPFCGSEVKIETYRDEGYIISCKHHDWPKREINKAIEPECIAGDIDLCSWGLGDKARNALIAAWNSRAERTCEFNIKDNMNETEGMGDVWIECSACNCVFDFYADEWLMKMSYCPNCGCKVVKR